MIVKEYFYNHVFMYVFMYLSNAWTQISVQVRVSNIAMRHSIPRSSSCFNLWPKMAL